ncbi:SMC-Scp complex subunit ScpB [Staphylococcus canis]|uniref:SMC-Scp complex subunit ScpB n=1 Tax=Staphylococcus canis TaxID=2724942 RepID=A0ABS0T9A8_9STAP|nr:SMC-Scp complex subunit ScpB [Staphylococcus canis]MBI5975338.1 SMC-Scp complex subunit ScpB [Staphylococcus canis]
MNTQLTEALVAILYTVGEGGIHESELLEVLNIEQKELNKLIDSLHIPGLVIEHYGQSYMLATQKETAPFIESLVLNHNSTKLSQAAMEVLAIIAYNQPITRGDIEFIRGVNSDGPVKTLIAKGLVLSKTSPTSRAQHLHTTDLFLNVFGLSQLDDLPTTDEDDEEIEQFFKNLTNQKGE